MCKLTQIRLLFNSIESTLLGFNPVMPDGDKLDLVFETTAISHWSHWRTYAFITWGDRPRSAIESSQKSNGPCIMAHMCLNKCPTYENVSLALRKFLVVFNFSHTYSP
eukprot:TRINITY_DN28280_c0_g1_i1.p1 TRINITY_DN28280_c0_g1~~TRINITY_DN28280_c0_g1_i1.p1  ORF type:complete len:108 (+),score=1.61 TRINITY_DN28280_c0_g1_i1:64-387(+)